MPLTPHEKKLSYKQQWALIANVLSDPESVKKLYEVLTDADSAHDDQNEADRLGLCDLNEQQAEFIKAGMLTAKEEDKKATMISLLYQLMLAGIVKYDALKEISNKNKSSLDTNKFHLPFGDKLKSNTSITQKLPGEVKSLDEFNQAIAALPAEARADFTRAQERAGRKRLYALFVFYEDVKKIPHFQITFEKAEKEKKLSPKWGQDSQLITKESVVELDRQENYSPTGVSMPSRVNLLRVNNCVLNQKDMIALIYNGFDSDTISGATGRYGDELNNKPNFASKIFFKKGADVWRICAKEENGLTIFYKFKSDDWEKAKSNGMPKKDFLASAAIQPMFGYDFDRQLCKQDGSPHGPDGLEYCQTVRHAVGETPRHTCELAKQNVIDANFNVIQRGPPDAAGADVKKKPTSRTGASAFSAAADADLDKTPDSTMSASADSTSTKTPKPTFK